MVRFFVFFSEGGMEEKGIGRKESREERQELEAWLAEPLDSGVGWKFLFFQFIRGGMDEKMFVYRGLRFARWSR